MMTDKKCILMMFAEFLLTLLISVFGFMLLSWTFDYSWGMPVYSIIFTLVFFAFIYCRMWNKAKSDIKYQKENVSLKHAFKVILPLAAFLAVIVALFGLIKLNIIPVRDIVTDVQYILEENQPRQIHEVLLIDNLNLVMRALFIFLIGFFKSSDTSVLILFVAPAVVVVAGLLGYFAGMRKFYLSDVIAGAQQKVKDKFNE
ncbi:MAG: hypothetical protein IKW59_04425 [Clostridia bacterium]|nr:hypothetical protein [Clostridia bacterium]